MGPLKTRIVSFVTMVIGAGLLWYNWHQIAQKGEYSLKVAASAPLLIIGGLFMLAFPSFSGKPETAKEKLLVLGVLVVGFAAGVVDVYLMDPGFFRF